MPPTWSGALSPHHHLKVLAAPPGMPPSTWLWRLRSRVLFSGTRSLRDGASLRIVVRPICLPVWLLGAPVHLQQKLFQLKISSMASQTFNLNLT